MQIDITVKLAPELAALITRLIEAIWDLAEVIAPLTGYKVVRK